MPLLKKGQKLQPVKYDIIKMEGGLDLTTPSLELPSGYVRNSVNFEVATVGGYGRIGGYERFDGRPSPSAATYLMLQVSSFTNVPSVGDVVTGQTSGATGVVVVVETSQFYFIVTKVTVGFVVGEVLKVGVTTIGTSVTPTVILTNRQSAQYVQAAADNYRTDIQKVPGDGPVRGEFTLIVSGVDNTYAFRDNMSGTNTLLYKSTSAGWVLVPYFNEISFTVGNGGPPLDGQTLTQGGVTATIQ